MTNQYDTAKRLRRIKWLALALCVLSLLVVFISAYVRLATAGYGCADWPACYGQSLADKLNVHLGFARVLHRIGASSSLLLAFVLAWQALQPQPLQPVSRRATTLLVLMLFLAAVGLWSSDPHRSLVTLINILGGLALVSLAWQIASADGGKAPPVPRNVLLLPGRLALLATMLMGGLIGARYAATSCMSLPVCGEVAWPSGGFAALNPFVVITAALPAGDAGGVTLHLLHRYAALLTLLLLGGAAHVSMRYPATRKAAIALLLLLAVELALGALTVATGFGFWLAVGHSVTAALLLAAATSLRRT